MLDRPDGPINIPLRAGGAPIYEGIAFAAEDYLCDVERSLRVVLSWFGAEAIRSRP